MTFIHENMEKQTWSLEVWSCPPITAIRLLRNFRSMSFAVKKFRSNYGLQRTEPDNIFQQLGTITTAYTA